MSFCVECGKEGPIYEGLCQDCLPRKRTFLKVPSHIDLVQCAHCGGYQLRGGWSNVDLEEAIRSEVAASAAAPRDVSHHSSRVTFEFEDERNLRVHLSAIVNVGELSIREEKDLRVRLKRGICPICSRQQGRYYEAILQVRAGGRPLTEDELRAVRMAVQEKVSSTRGLFVSREELVHGGIDVYLSSSEAAKALAHSLRGSLGGDLKASPRLHTRRQGRNVYRVTYLVRLPGLKAGDVVDLNGRPHLLLSSGEAPQALDLEAGVTRKLRRRELAHLRPVRAEVIRATVVSAEGDEVQVMDSREFRMWNARRVQGVSPGQEVSLVLTDNGVYVAPSMEAERS